MSAYIRHIKYCCLNNFKISRVKFKLAKKNPSDRHDYLKNNELDYNAFKIAFESQERVIMFECLDERFDEFDNC